MGYYLAKFVSFLFHPSLLLPYIVALLYWLHPYEFTAITQNGMLRILGLLLVNTLLLPALLILLLRSTGFASDFQLKKRKERLPVLFVFTFVLGGIWWQLSDVAGIPPILLLTILSAAFSLLVALVANLYTKISLHSIAIANGAAVLFATASSSPYNEFLLLPVLFVVGGFLGSARLYLGEHTESQVYWGYFVGWFVPIFVFLWG